MLKVALLSRWHVHADEYASYALVNQNVEVVKVWDEDVIRGRKWADELGVGFEENIDQLFADPTIDGVVISSPTSMHKELILKAANTKKHIFTEKVLAFTVKDCLELYEAIETNQVKLMVSLPRLMDPYFLYIQDAIKNGVIGKVNTIRCKVAHDGALPINDKQKGWLPDYFFNEQLCGGGAFIDFGAHPIYLTNRLGGDIKHISANLSRFNHTQVDDHALVMVEYQSGALGILEASFVTRGCPFILEVFGTDGTILVEDHKLKIRSALINNDKFMEPKLPNCLPNAFTQWVDSILNNSETFITKEDVIRLTEINELAYLSHHENRRVFKK